MGRIEVDGMGAPSVGHCDLFHYCFARACSGNHQSQVHCRPARPESNSAFESNAASFAQIAQRFDIDLFQWLANLLLHARLELVHLFDAVNHFHRREPFAHHEHQVCECHCFRTQQRALLGLLEQARIDEARSAVCADIPHDLSHDI